MIFFHFAGAKQSAASTLSFGKLLMSDLALLIFTFTKFLSTTYQLRRIRDCLSWKRERTLETVFAVCFGMRVLKRESNRGIQRSAFDVMRVSL